MTNGVKVFSFFFHYYIYCVCSLSFLPKGTKWADIYCVIRTSDSLVTEQHQQYVRNYMYRLPSRTIIIAAGQAVFFLNRSVYCAVLRTERDL